VSFTGLENCHKAKIKYGQQQYDFDEGVMFFIAPHQVFGIKPDKNELSKQSGGTGQL